MSDSSGGMGYGGTAYAVSLPCSLPHPHNTAVWLYLDCHSTGKLPALSPGRHHHPNRFPLPWHSKSLALLVCEVSSYSTKYAIVSFAHVGGRRGSVPYGAPFPVGMAYGACATAPPSGYLAPSHHTCVHTYNICLAVP
jgi:hypothetical protein